MPYDFTNAKTELNKAIHVDGWTDNKSAQLKHEYLLPLFKNTLYAESLADQISSFILEIEIKLSEITNTN